MQQYTLTEKEKLDYFEAKGNGPEALEAFWLNLAAERRLSYFTGGYSNGTKYPSPGPSGIIEVFAIVPHDSQPGKDSSMDLFSQQDRTAETAPVENKPQQPQELQQEEDEGFEYGIKINRIESDNFKKLNIAIDVEGRSFYIKGENGIGKSSIIDAIETTLRGMQDNTTKRPVQNGADSARNEIELILERDIEANGRVMVKGTIITAIRKFTAAGTNTLTVKVDGKNASSPAELLKWLLGYVAISDPTDLWNMREIDRKKYLTQLSGIEAELNIIEEKKNNTYDEKYAVEQEIERLKKDLAEFDDVPEVVEEKDLTTLQADIKARQDKFKEGQDQRLIVESTEKEVHKIEQAITGINHDIINTQVEVKGYEQQIIVLQNKIKDCNTLIDSYNHDLIKEQGLLEVHSNNVLKEKEKLDKIAAEYNALPDRTEELNNLQAANKLFIRGQQRDDFRRRLNDQYGKQEDVMSRIAEVEQERKDLFSRAKLPIPGLTISSEGVMYRGVPLTKDQISEAEGLELCMDILIAQKPALKLISLKTGHALSNSSLERVLRKAKYKNYQIIIEKVSDSQDIEIEFFETK